MKHLLTLCFIALFSSSCLAGGYTLMTINTPNSKNKDVKTAEGFFIELLNEMFARAELSLRTKEEPWIRSQEKVIAADPKEALVIAPITRTKERENQYDWITSLISYRMQFVSNDKSLDISSLDKLKTYPICVLRASQAENRLKALGFPNINASVFEQRCYKEMKAGTTKVILMHGQAGAQKNYKNAGGDPAELVYGLEFPEEQLYLASTKGAVSEADKAKLNKALDAIKKDGTYEKITAKYFD